MNVERWRRRSIPAPKTGALPPIQVDSSAEEPLLGDVKKPRVLSKAFRSLSNSSLESLSPNYAKTAASTRRLSKTPSNSSSMIERIHRRRVSKDSVVIPSPHERPASPIDQPLVSMEIIEHGYLKADVSLLKARPEYLVLADQCLMKFSSAEAAKIAFPQLMNPEASPGTDAAHHSTSPKPAAGAETRLEIPLRSIVAVFNDEGSSPRFGIEIWWHSPWPRLSYCKTQFFFGLPKERDSWMASIQRACRARLRKAPVNDAIPENIKTRINHIVASTELSPEDGPSQNLIFPVARRPTGQVQKTSATEETQTLMDGPSFYLAIGPCMCYFVEVLKADYNTAAGELRVKAISFGTVTLTRFKASVASYEQRFVMNFRSPFEREARLDLASAHYRRIIEALTKVDRILKPMWPQHFQQTIFDVKGLPPPLHLTSGNDLGGLERSLHAYCTAFHVQTPLWTIEWNAPNQPTFRLVSLKNGTYLPLQLLAVFRALRYNSFFKAISLRNVDLSPLAGKKDFNQYGDSIVHTSLSGTRIPVEVYEMLQEAPVLSQEIHALMFASESIRSIDLTNALGPRTTKPAHSRADDDARHLQLSSELIRPLMMLMKAQICLCQSILFRGNLLAPNDVDDLASLLLDGVCVRRLDLANCGLGDAGLTKLWAGLSGQHATLEVLDTSNNQGTVKFEVIRNTLSHLRAVRKLHIVGNTRIDSDMSLLSQSAMSSWTLHEIDMSGIILNDATVEVFAEYLESSQSQDLQLIRLNRCGLTGRHIARIFRGMGQGRRLTIHLDGSRLDEGIEDLCAAIACGYAPWCLFLQMVEFNYETSYVRLLRALTVNRTIECLSLAGTATPDAASDTACKAVSEFFQENTCVRYLDISGYDAKLDEGRLGREFSKSLIGVRANTRIEHLRVRSQMLNINIGDLAEAISGNKTLRTLDCEGNDFNLSNFRHLVKHLEDNTGICQFSALSSTELWRSMQKAVENAKQSTVTQRRSSMISRLKHDKVQPGAENILTQQLKDEWNGAVAASQRILERNQRIYDDNDQSDSDGTSSSAIANRDGEAIFAAAFGGLALKDYESRRAKESPGSRTPPAYTLAVRPKPNTLSSQFGNGEVERRPSRSFSTISSEVALSPMTDGASSGSGAPTPPEPDSPMERTFSLRSPFDSQTVLEEVEECSFVFSDVRDTNRELQVGQ